MDQCCECTCNRTWCFYTFDSLSALIWSVFCYYCSPVKRQTFKNRKFACNFILTFSRKLQIINKILSTIYGVYAMSRTQSVNWYLPFKCGQISIEKFKLCSHMSWGSYDHKCIKCVSSDPIRTDGLY